VYKQRIVCYSIEYMARKRLLDRRGNVVAHDFKFTGEEPTWTDSALRPASEYYRTRERALRFYTYYCDAVFLKEQTLTWMAQNGYSKKQISAIRSLPNHMPAATIGKLARMLNVGMPDLHPGAIDYFAKKYEDDDSHLKPTARPASQIIHKEISDCLALNIEPVKIEDKPKAVKPRINPQTRLENKVGEEILVELEGLLDSIIEVQVDVSPAKIPAMNLGNLLRSKNIPARGVKYVIEWLQRYIDEFNAASNKEDVELVEGYGWLKPAQLRRIISNFEKMIEDAKAHAAIKQKDRKPRQTKVKSADKQTSKLKYAINSSEYALESIDPTRIPFSQKLYVFNVKYRQLTIYVAANGTGFSVSGTSIKDFDKEKSVTLTLRKPQDILPIILSGTPRKIDNAITKLKTKTKPANGRCNDNIILLRSFDN